MNITSEAKCITYNTNHKDQCVNEEDHSYDVEKALMYLSSALKNLKHHLNKKTTSPSKKKKKDIKKLQDAISNTLHYIALLHKDMYLNYTKSLTLLTAAHKLRQYIYGKNHIILGKNKYIIGIVLSYMGRYSDAMKFFCDALIIYNEKKKVGEGYINKDFVIDKCDSNGNKRIGHNIKQWIIYLREELKKNNCSN